MIRQVHQTTMIKSLTKQPLLLANTIIEGFLGIWVITLPGNIRSLAELSIPNSLIQVCGLLALSVASFSVLGAIYIVKSSDYKTLKAFIYLCLSIFHTALTIGLFYGAISGDINYIGVIIHLPLALLFIIGWLKLAKPKSAQ